MASINPSDYSHSPIHTAILARDHTALQLSLSSLPRLSDPSTILTESASLSEESTADTISAAIDRRDVPNRDTPLHLAVRLSDSNAVELLMSSGADWSLQNSLGWSPLQDAICAREEALAKIIVRHSHSLAFAKWRRRLPRIIATMRRMRDFYMELTFNFESSVIPFISRIAPSDTYKIWKRGANLRADMTLAGFDGFKIQRSDQSVLFLGEGSEDGDIEIPAGALCIVSHKKKEVMNALEHAGAPATEKEVQHEVNSMLKTNILRPGIDVTKAVLLPQMTWRRQERKDSVGPWKAKVYDMHHVVVSVKTRQVPSAASAATAASATSSSPKSDSQSECDEFADVLTVEERKQLEDVLKMECPDVIDDNVPNNYVGRRHSCPDVIDDNVPNNYVGRRHSCYEQREISENEPIQEEGRVVGINGGQKKIAPARSSLCEEKVSNLLGDSPPPPPRSLSRPPGRPSMDSKRRGSRKSGKDEGKESEYKKGLRPVLWLSPNFPLRTEELLPLLDILANKVKAIRRLRELLTTKLPPGTFPVKVAIPVVPTIRVIVTFTKFEELEPEEEFSTPPSSPEKKSPKARSGNSWHKWMKGRDQDNNGRLSGSCSSIEDIQDPFKIPPDYKWITLEMKKKRMLQKRRKASKGRVQTK